jgi:F0F1-type ATP synthase delta subunit
MKKHYISAVLELLQSGKEVDSVLSDLLSALKRKGHEKLYVQVLTGVLRSLCESQSSVTSRVVVAKESDYKTLKEAINEALISIGGETKDAQVSIDETLIGGFITSHKGKLINRSYKERLVSLYRSITK